MSVGVSFANTLWDTMTTYATAGIFFDGNQSCGYVHGEPDYGTRADYHVNDATRNDSVVVGCGSSTLPTEKTNEPVSGIFYSCITTLSSDVNGQAWISTH